MQVGRAAMDDNGHGTFVAGTLGAVGNNKLGTAGITWRVQLLACKMIDSSGEGDTGAAVKCVQWCR